MIKDMKKLKSNVFMGQKCVLLLQYNWFVWLFSDYYKICSWEHREGIQTAGSLLTCKDGEGDEKYGARHRKAFSDEFPSFKVSSNILFNK